MASFKALVEATSGAAGGFFSAGSLYPMEVAKSRIQAAGPAEATPSVGEALREIYDKGGVPALYKGWYVSASQSATEKFIHYYWYELLCRLYTRIAPIGPVANVAIGYVSEWMHIPLTMPIEVTSTVYQKNRGSSDRSWIETAAELSKSGWGRFYEGIGAYAGLNLKPALQDATFDQIKRLFGAVGRTQLSDVQVFLLGVLARCVATIIVYPAQKAKVLAITAQKSAGKGAEGKAVSEPVPNGVVACILYVLKTGGISALYAGLRAELYRGCMSAGLMYLLKERIKRVIVTVMYLLARKKH